MSYRPFGGAGALGSFGAALLEPYSDKPETSGILINPPEETSALIQQLVEDVRGVFHWHHLRFIDLIPSLCLVIVRP